jgi:hypothetical protein
MRVRRGDPPHAATRRGLRSEGRRQNFAEDFSMPHTAAALCLALCLSLPPAARAQPPIAEGRIVSDTGRTEILGRPVRVGETIELPEGFIRVEEEGIEDRDVGSFTVLPAESFARMGEAWASPEPLEPGRAFAGVVEGAEARAHAGAPVRRPGPDCRTERARYLSELWRISGIEVSDPDALMEGLEGADRGSTAGFYWFALATDPFRPLAWSSELRGRAEALARCVRGD